MFRLNRLNSLAMVEQDNLQAKLLIELTLNSCSLTFFDIIQYIFNMLEKHINKVFTGKYITN